MRSPGTGCALLALVALVLSAVGVTFARLLQVGFWLAILCILAMLLGGWYQERAARRWRETLKPRPRARVVSGPWGPRGRR